MGKGIGWNFPPTGGGRGDGYRHTGISHFDGAPLESLARETLQNSLDAPLDDDKPVQASFELGWFPRDLVGADQLAVAVQASVQSAETIDPAAVPRLREALELLSASNLQVLRISDDNTTGLRENQWKALVKMQGISVKQDEGAGGSHGAGKFAPFAVSALRTVFYWTNTEGENGHEERLQGVAILMSHDSQQGETQGTGFWGIRDNCVELREDDIPAAFRHTNVQGEAIRGTSLMIVGFRPPAGWRERIVASVLRNFFYAIAERRLIVHVEPENDPNQISIRADSIVAWFNTLMGPPPSIEDDDELEALSRAREFYNMSRQAHATERQDPYFGHCRLWIHVGDGMARRVALIRKTGMLITTEQAGLIRFAGFKDFAAMCVFEDPKGNERLRDMENPRHDQFEPDRLRNENESRQARAALRRITRWIRDEISKLAGPAEGDATTVLSELEQYLPDIEPEESFDDEESDEAQDREPNFDNRFTIKLSPTRPSSPTAPEGTFGEDEIEGQSDDGDSGGAGTGDNGGDGTQSGPSDGQGSGGTGDGGTGPQKSRRIPVSNVRLLPVDGPSNQFRLSFAPARSGTARLTLAEAGDSFSTPSSGVRATDPNVSLERIPVVQGQRTEVIITANESLGGRAWIISATETEEH